MNLNRCRASIHFWDTVMLRRTSLISWAICACTLGNAQTTAYSTNFDAFTTTSISGQDSWAVDVREGSDYTVTSTLSHSGTKSCRYTGTAVATPGNQYAYRAFFDSFRSETYVATVFVRVSLLSIGQAWVGLSAYGTNSQGASNVGNGQAGIYHSAFDAADGFLFMPTQITRENIAPFDEWTRIQVIVRGFNGVASNTGFTASNINGMVVGPVSPGTPSDYKQIDDFDLWVFNPSGTAVTAYFDDLKVERYPLGQNWLGGRARAAGWPVGKTAPVTIIIRRPDGTAVETATATADGEGYFKVKLNNFSGDCDIFIKTATSLSKKVGTITPAAAVSYYHADYAKDLIPGDCDNNDFINTDDYIILSNAFDTIEGDGGFDVRADLDGNGYVNTDDYLLLNVSFDTAGDAYPL